MMILRCTTKAFQKIGKRPQLVEVDKADNDFGEWYINTVDSVNRGNLFMVAMHADSLYSMFIPIEKNVDLSKYVHTVFANLLLRILRLEVPTNNAEQIMASYNGEAIFTKTNSRSLVSYLTTIVKEIGAIMQRPEDFVQGDKLNLTLLEHRINDTPRSLKKNTIWPLNTFYKCIRQFCPELPVRRTLPFDYFGWSYPEKFMQVFNGIDENLMLKVKASSLEAEVLFSLEEARTLVEAVEDSQQHSSDIPEQLYTDILRMLRFQVQKLETQI